MTDFDTFFAAYPAAHAGGRGRARLIWSELGEPQRAAAMAWLPRFLGRFPAERPAPPRALEYLRDGLWDFSRPLPPWYEPPRPGWLDASVALPPEAAT